MAKSALGAAKRVVAGTSKKSSSPIIVASEVRDFANPSNVLFSRDQVAEAIQGYAEGDSLFKQGEALKKLHRPTVEAFGQHNYVQGWANDGTFPEHNPKLVVNSDASGTLITYMVIDKEVKIDEGQFANLANLIGAPEAEANTVKRDEIYFNQDRLETQVEVKEKGKTVSKSVLELIDEAVSTALTNAGREDLLDGLFEIKPKFTTRKGLIKKGLSLVGASPTKLAEFVDATQAIVSLRPGNGGSKAE
jgi:hypothetical protein